MEIIHFYLQLSLFLPPPLPHPVELFKSIFLKNKILWFFLVSIFKPCPKNLSFCKGINLIFFTDKKPANLRGHIDKNWNCMSLIKDMLGMGKV